MGQEISQSRSGAKINTPIPSSPASLPKTQGDQDRHIHQGTMTAIDASLSMPATGRLLPTQQADGHTQMALDAGF